MVTAMDDQIGRVVQALDKRGMRDNTLIVFQSDNGGPRDAKFTGEVDMSKSVIPVDNGPWREGKASLYEGGTRVLALANWPGHIPAGSVIDQPIHMVDMYPTMAALAGGSLDKAKKPMDGLDMGPTLLQGKPSPRTEVVYNIEPFRAAVREGDWKLVWQATLPSKVELFDLAQDPSEANNLAGAHPDKVAELQQRIQVLAGEGVAPLIMGEIVGATRHTLFGAVVTPEEQQELVHEP
jgi:arylsulfatase A-like enzyme